MDINLARTFLEIVACRSFVQAAERLNITQTAVGARVKALEDQLGRRLFVRNRAGASLTPAGELFVPHARALVQVWERARQQVAIPAGRRALVAVGCETSLWAPLLVDWLLWMRNGAPDLALRASVGNADELVEQVVNGTLDIAVVYAPRHRPGLRIELLIEEKLVLVSTDPAAKAPRPHDYVFVDWGREFATQHSMAFPELSGAPISASLGPLGLGYLLAAGGSGYFRQNVVQPHVDSGELHRIPRAPEFLYLAYAVSAENADMTVLKPSLLGLRHAADPKRKRARR